MLKVPAQVRACLAREIVADAGNSALRAIRERRRLTEDARALLLSAYKQLEAAGRRRGAADPVQWLTDPAPDVLVAASCGPGERWRLIKRELLGRRRSDESEDAMKMRVHLARNAKANHLLTESEISAFYARCAQDKRDGPGGPARWPPGCRLPAVPGPGPRRSRRARRRPPG